MQSSTYIDFPHLTRQASRRYSERVALRPLHFSDVGPLWQATRNPAFNQFITWVQPASLVELEARVDTLLDKGDSAQGSFISAVVRDTGEWVSLFRVFPPHADLERPESVETGIWTHPNFWASGISKELSSLLVDSVFLDSKAKSLVALGEVSNKAVLRLFQACGLHHVDNRKHPFENGELHDVAFYEITREQWEQLSDSKKVA